MRFACRIYRRLFKHGNTQFGVPKRRTSARNVFGYVLFEGPRVVVPFGFPWKTKFMGTSRKHKTNWASSKTKHISYIYIYIYIIYIYIYIYSHTDTQTHKHRHADTQTHKHRHFTWATCRKTLQPNLGRRPNAEGNPCSRHRPDASASKNGVVLGDSKQPALPFASDASEKRRFPLKPRRAYTSWYCGLD